MRLGQNTLQNAVVYFDNGTRLSEVTMIELNEADEPTEEKNTPISFTKEFSGSVKISLDDSFKLLWEMTYKYCDLFYASKDTINALGCLVDAKKKDCKTLWNMRFLVAPCPFGQCLKITDEDLRKQAFRNMHENKVDWYEVDERVLKETT